MKNKKKTLIIFIIIVFIIVIITGGIILFLNKDKNELNKVVPNLEQLLEKNDLCELQIAIMCAIDKTLDEDEEATLETLKLEKIYDRISRETKLKALEKKYSSD